jgi:hypothetical protein
MNKATRDALAKDGFMKSTRQIWCAVFVGCAFIVMLATIAYGIEPSAFMNFFLAIGTTFILGESVTSFAKTQSASSIKQIEVSGEIERHKIREQKLAPQKVRDKQRQELLEDPIDPSL